MTDQETIDIIHRWDDRLCDIISGQDYPQASEEVGKHLLELCHEMREVAPWD